jgi:hypothetical protein
MEVLDPRTLGYRELHSPRPTGQLGVTLFMHAHIPLLDINAVLQDKPVEVSSSVKKLLIFFVIIGFVTFGVGALFGNAAHTWAAYYTFLIFFMGMSAGGIIITAMLQIVRARWAVPVRRFAEANVFFLPAAYAMLLFTYFGKQYLFPWANAPMPGREWWMQPNFVYARFALLFALLYCMMWRYVRMSLRSDVAMMQKNRGTDIKWFGWIHSQIVKDWKGEEEIDELQRRLSWNAPLLILVYAVVVSLFAFEMVMGMDVHWMSNLFGAFIFMGNIYAAWAMLGLTTLFYAKTNPQYNRVLDKQQYWDIGKLTFAFCMIWGYFFFSQFLPQWYGNLPEETQWMILRTREFPWKGLGWITFACCFIIPFITLLSEDLKRTPRAFAAICILILFGILSERYLIIMPQISPSSIPFSVEEIGLFLGFFGLYGLCIQQFMSLFPFATLSHPVAKGRVDW